MVSSSAAQMIRTHGDHIGAIYRAVGGNAFTAAELRRCCGIAEPKECTFLKLSARGIVEREKGVRRGPTVWRLRQEILSHYVAQEVGA